MATCYAIIPATGKITIDDKGSNASGDNIKHITIDNKGHLWLLSDQMVKEYNPRSRLTGYSGHPTRPFRWIVSIMLRLKATT